MTEIVVPSDAELDNLVLSLANRLLSLEWVMACAESCTGGWIAKCCTDRAGSSAWFERGLVTYSNRAKEELLGVNAPDLMNAGAVSQSVAMQMAEGARDRSGVDVALAVTGIAGPDGGSPDKPVGTVWFGWSLPGRTDAELCRFDGGRDAVRRLTVAHALRGMIDRLER